MIERMEALERSTARQHLKTEWTKLYLLDRRDKTPDVRRRMLNLYNKFMQWA